MGNAWASQFFVRADSAKAEDTTPQTSLLPPTAAAAFATKGDGKLPQPVKYEEIQREAYMTLKPDLFEGFRLDFTKQINAKFSLSHSVVMCNAEMPMQGATSVIKVPYSTYEFGANLIDTPNNKYLLLGRITSDGRMTGRAKLDYTDALSARLQANLSPERNMSQVMLDIDVKGAASQAQLKIGSPMYLGANGMVSVTPELSLGAEYFAMLGQKKQGCAVAGRYACDGWIGTAQLATTGLVSLSYMHKVSEKIAAATDLLYNWNSGDVSSSVGYDYIFNTARLRGRVESTGAVGVFLEERLNAGVTMLFSAEVDHARKDYKFGFGMTIGE